MIKKKSILLLGDSVRMGYDEYVKESMKNLADVVFPTENCRFAEYMLRNIHSWADDLNLTSADAVHWNAGLWDTVKIYGDDCLTSPSHYAQLIERIIKRIIFLFPNAKIIFATSTPCIESGYIRDFEYRENKDIEKYNEIACEIAKEYSVIINDLYTLLKDKPESLHSDQTHYYTPDATLLIGGQVNRVLCDALGIDIKVLDVPDKEKFVRPDVKGDRELYIKNGKYYSLKG